MCASRSPLCTFDPRCTNSLTIGALMRGSIAACAIGESTASAVISSEIGPTAGCSACTDTSASGDSSAFFLQPVVSAAHNINANGTRIFIDLEPSCKSLELSQRQVITN